MKVLIVGLGSMGKRRLRLLKNILPDADYAGVDSQESRRQESGITAYASLDEALTAYMPDAVIVCTSPLSHNAIIRTCLNAGAHVFTEINLVSDGYEDNIKLADKTGKILFMSSTFLYRDETKYICDVAKKQTKPVSYRYHVGQYLPDWHPWESYTDYFIGDARTNGCRELMAIEFPWLIEAFGKITDVQVTKRKLTTLQTNYNDCVQLLLTHENGNIGSVCIDVVSRKAVRLFELIGEDVYLTWSGTPDSLTEYDTEKKCSVDIDLTESVEHQDGYAAFVVENAYTNELQAFINAIQIGTNTQYGFKEDYETIMVIDEIEAK